MADRPAPQLQQTASYNPETDFFLLVKGTAEGPRSGPFLLTAAAIVAAGGDGGGGGGGGGGGTSPVTSVFERIGAIVAEDHDYFASQVDYDPAASGLNASNVQAAIDAVAALSGVLPPPTSEGHFLGLDGNLDPFWSALPVISVFGRTGVISLQLGDVSADLVVDANGFVIMTDAERTKLAALSTARQVPAGGTTGQLLAKNSNTDYDVEYVDPPVGGGGGSLSQIDLLAICTPLAAAPPTYKYVAGCGGYSYSQSGSDELRGEFRWPSGAGTVKIQFISETATTGNGAFTFDMMAVTPGDAASVATDSFATSNVSNTVAVPGTAQYLVEASVTVTNDDGVASGDNVRWRLKRKTDVGSNAAGALQVRTATILFA